MTHVVDVVLELAKGTESQTRILRAPKHRYDARGIDAQGLLRVTSGGLVSMTN